MRIKYGLKELELEFGALTFGALLRSHRIGEEMSQVEMAKLLKISKQSLNDLERERTLPSIGRAADIARKLGFLEASMVQLAIQDLIRREKLSLRVTVEHTKHKKVS